MITIERTKNEHIRFVSARLRKGDKLELEHAGRKDYQAAVKESVAVSSFAFTALHNGVPMCLFGLRPDGLLSRRARVWLLGTGEINTTKKDFVRTCRAVLNGLLDIYPELYNAVDDGYPQAKRLLQFLGARFTRKVFAKTGRPFILFEIRRNQ